VLAGSGDDNAPTAVGEDQGRRNRGTLLDSPRSPVSGQVSGIALERISGIDFKMRDSEAYSRSVWRCSSSLTFPDSAGVRHGQDTIDKSRRSFVTAAAIVTHCAWRSPISTSDIFMEPL